MGNAAIILAGGSSTRMSGKIPKQFMKINGKMVIEYSVRTFINYSRISVVIVVVPAEHKVKCEKLFPEVNIVVGGSTRKESAYNGLKQCPPNTEKVLIHDAARMFVNTDIIENCLDSLDNFDSVSVGLPATDTTVQQENLEVKTFLNREELYHLQTPQGFKFEKILKAHENSNNNVTDDLSLMHNTGIQSHIIPGKNENFKITTEYDFKLAQLLLKV